jgi:peptidyl-prolyl cis-trans isomerase C
VPKLFNASVFVAALALSGSSVACESTKRGGVAAGPAASALTRESLAPELRDRVLAKVGDRTITLGDYVSALERMDAFERLRYQTPERRKLLLDEMIDVALLAREAERRGLDKEPATEAYVRQLLREEALRRLRDSQPRVEDLPAQEVSAYYDAHLKDFHDPERRRVAVIALPEQKLAVETLEVARSADAKRWGELVRERSRLPAKFQARADGSQLPVEFAGDLGLVTAPGETRGNNARVPEVVRRAVFELRAADAIYERPVEEDGVFYIVRLLSVSPARQRTLEEAQATIRVRLLQERLRRAEQEQQQELRRKYPVLINEEVLAQLKLAPAGPGRPPDLAATPPALPSTGSPAPAVSPGASVLPSAAPSAP